MTGFVGLTDSTGAAITSSNPVPIVLSAGATTSGVAATVSTALEGSRVLKASAGTLLSLSATIGATSGYVMLFDATSAPVDGAVTPKWFFPVNSNGTFGGMDKDWRIPLLFATGITVVFSTTGPFTKTISTTAAFSAQVN